MFQCSSNKCLLPEPCQEALALWDGSGSALQLEFYARQAKRVLEMTVVREEGWVQWLEH